MQDEEETEQQPQAEQPEDSQLTEATETYGKYFIINIVKKK